MWIMTAEGWKQLAPKAIATAPRNGMFIPVSAEVAARESVDRARAYEYAVRRYIAEEIPLERLYDCWSEPVIGAFGETIR